MKPLFSILFLFLIVKASSQNISGIYTGTLTNDTLKMIQSYQLALSEYRGKITGYSYITFVTNDTFYYGIKRIKATIENNQIIVEDVEMLANNYPKRPDKGVRVVNIIPLPKNDSVLDLSGTWKTTKTKRFYSIGGTMKLRKDKDSANSALINHLKELKIIKEEKQEEFKTAKVEIKQKKTRAPATEEKQKTAPPVVAEKNTEPPISPVQRNTKTIESISVRSDSLVLSFYDNGVVDGDVISVYFNDQNILSNIRLTEHAAKKTVHVNFKDADEFKLTLVAETLGSIPPNTGLLIIQDGDQKYQVRFSADMQNNASIIIRKAK